MGLFYNRTYSHSQSVCLSVSQPSSGDDVVCLTAQHCILDTSCVYCVPVRLVILNKPNAKSLMDKRSVLLLLPSPSHQELNGFEE